MYSYCLMDVQCVGGDFAFMNPFYCLMAVFILLI